MLVDAGAAQLVGAVAALKSNFNVPPPTLVVLSRRPRG